MEAVILEPGCKSSSVSGLSSDILKIWSFRFPVHFPRTFIRTARWFLPSNGLEDTLKGCHSRKDSSRTWRKIQPSALYCRSTWWRNKTVQLQHTTFDRKCEKYIYKWINNITCRFWNDQFDCITWKGPSWKYINCFSRLTESQKTIEHEKEDSCSCHSEKEIANMHGQEDNKDYIQLMCVEK